MLNCLCSCPALSDASDTLSRIPTTYTRRRNARRADVMRGTRRPNALPFSPTPCGTFLAPPLCFFVRAKIINGAMPGLPGTPECQFPDNDEVCTSGPTSLRRPLRTGTLEKKHTRLPREALLAFIIHSLFGGSRIRREVELTKLKESYTRHLMPDK